MNSIRPANFLTHYGPQPTRRSSKRMITIVLLVVVVCIVSLFALRFVLSIAEEANRAKDHLLYGVALANDQEFRRAREQIVTAEALLRDVAARLQPWQFVRVLPFVGRQVTAARDLISATERMSHAAEIGIAFADQLRTTVMGNKPLHLSAITSEQKRRFLAELFGAEPVLTAILRDVQAAHKQIASLPMNFLLPPLARVAAPLREHLPRLERSLTIALPLLKALPLVSGYPKEQTYLFLFQNNDELRPTGGFIGTYGLLTMRDGEIASLATDNIYRLDRLAQREKRLVVAPPAPLARHLNLTQWYLRDVNWSPDFPTTARQALSFYAQESRDRRPIDGVLAVTPTVVVRLLRLLGPLTIDHVLFTPENLVDTLQFYVERGYDTLGLPEVERKEIIGKLTKEIVARLLTLPLDRIPDLLDVVEGALRERHMLIYETNPVLQNIVAREGWDGAVHATDGDALMVVDANLAALKTDSVMERSSTYAVAPQGDRLRARLTLTYTNTGLFSWKTTRYRTYTRVYVPRGATLLRSSGFITEDKKREEKTAEVSEELGKTVFGGYLVVEPRSTRTVTLEYLLPATIRRDRYTLFVQKQAGTEANPLRVQLQFGTRITGWQPTGFTVERKGDAITFPTDLRVDRQFRVEF